MEPLSDRKPPRIRRPGIEVRKYAVEAARQQEEPGGSVGIAGRLNDLKRSDRARIESASVYLEPIHIPRPQALILETPDIPALVRDEWQMACASPAWLAQLLAEAVEDGDRARD